jgi:Na+/melibiose symporter-like transporter
LARHNHSFIFTGILLLLSALGVCCTLLSVHRQRERAEREREREPTLWGTFPHPLITVWKILSEMKAPEYFPFKDYI